MTEVQPDTTSPRAIQYARLTITMCAALLVLALTLVCWNFGYVFWARIGAYAFAASLALAGMLVFPHRSDGYKAWAVVGVAVSVLAFASGIALINADSAQSLAELGFAEEGGISQAWILVQRSGGLVLGYGLLLAGAFLFFRAAFRDGESSVRVLPPLLRPSSILLVALALSIGWGIRGNFGHEYGAMIAGGLAAVAACLLSGRDDWRQRAAYFGFFGACGWGFGGSMSYMQVVTYTHSGHWESQLYGFFTLYVLGFLWAAPGGLGAAIPAVWDRDRLTEIFRPIAWVFGFWVVLTLLYYLYESVSALDVARERHEGAIYWFDSDWMEAAFAIAAVCAFDLWDRRGERSLRMVGYGVIGAVGGFLAWGLLWLTGLGGWIGERITRRLGEERAPWDAFIDWLAAHSGRLPLIGDALKFESAPFPTAEQLADAPGPAVINWPQWFDGITERTWDFLGTGSVIGLLIGLGVYFYANGTFRSGSALLLYMAVGWFVGFLLLPVTLGIRMTPPRGDNWAGLLGLFGGAFVYFMRYNGKPILFASLVTGAVGGLGLALVTWLKLFLVFWGNPQVSATGEVSEAARHYQSQNWHSWFEQSYGFVLGIGLAIALGLLSTRYKEVFRYPKTRPWTEIFAAGFTFLGIFYLNARKNPAQWINQGAVAEAVEMPLVEGVALTPLGWFNLVFIVFAAAIIYLMVQHKRRQLPIVPANPLGKGQLLFIALLWAMVIANFERQFPTLNPGRVLTEVVIFVNACIATYMVLLLPRRAEVLTPRPIRSFTAHVWGWLVGGLVVAALLAPVFTNAIHLLYQPRALPGDVFSEVIAQTPGDAQGRRDAAVLDLYYNYPMGIGMLADLPREAVDLEAGTVTVNGDAVTIADETAERLADWIEARATSDAADNGGLFVHLDGGDIGRLGIWRTIRRYPHGLEAVHAGHSGFQKRIGPEAEWKEEALRKGKPHS